ncbi:3-methyl-2-oxobutanoate hydroxymethyltransferase [Neisseriaceae bacterium PsAf]|nr:3-methyl-2-oxobutanoate hydroxymethyltransferase [Neisseriaceae bacterium PsAf]MCV2502544.1 3-methyl-2-oxobutanoate hydroxymethyltransferase [Neisseriaceae bacterium]
MITVNTLKQAKLDQNKITMLTCYDSSFASLLDTCGIEILLVGDSLGMVMQGESSTLPVDLEDMCYHTRCVAKGNKNALVLSDLSFGSYEDSKEQAFVSASQLMKNGANMVKLEGGEYQAETIHFLQQRSIPVCAHIGLTPQAVNTIGGYKVQGKGDAAEQLLKDAKALDEAGASLMVMECVPKELAKKITKEVSCPTIGIGAGVYCDGQVLVLQDMLGIYLGKKAKFVKNFMQGQDSIENAIKAYIKAIKNLTYPDDEHSFL